MEKIINSIYGVIIYHMIIALLTLAVCCYIKNNNEPEYTNKTGYTYLSTIESSSL